MVINSMTVISVQFSSAISISGSYWPIGPKEAIPMSVGAMVINSMALATCSYRGSIQGANNIHVQVGTVLLKINQEIEIDTGYGNKRRN